MRSSIVVSASVLAFSLAAFACSSSGANGSTGTQQTAAPSSDGGTKKPVKIGGGSSSGGTKTPGSKEADAGSDVMPDPTPGLLPTCKGAALCVNDCPDNDDACFQACMKGMPDDEFAKFEAVGTCINNSNCETDVCVQETCGAEIKACLGE